MGAMIGIFILLFVAIIFVIKYCNKKLLKVTLTVIITITILYCIMLCVDMNRVNALRTPIFMQKTEEKKSDELSVITYRGLGYEVEYEIIQLPDSTLPIIVKTNMYIFYTVISRNYDYY